MAADDVDVMRCPEDWRENPILRVRRRRETGRPPERGLLAVTHWGGSVEPIVHLVDAHDLDKGGMLMSDGSIRRVISVDPKTGIKEMRDVERIRYASFEEVVADGWLVE